MATPVDCTKSEHASVVQFTRLTPRESRAIPLVSSAKARVPVDDTGGLSMSMLSDADARAVGTASVTDDFSAIPEHASRRGVSTARSSAVHAKSVNGARETLTTRGHSGHGAGGAAAGSIACGDSLLTDERAASRWETHREIANDRDLLEAIGLTDADVSAFLGKSRQTLNNQLGAKRDRTAPRAYFKSGELLTLMTAARQWNPSFDDKTKRAVLAHIEGTRDGKGDGAYRLLIDSLRGGPEVNLDDAKGIVMIAPDFLGLLSRHRAIVDRLQAVADDVSSRDDAPWIVVLSSSSYQSKMASQTLGLSANQVRTASHDYVEHYLPMILVYDDLSEKAEPRPFIVSAEGALVPAPQYRGPMMSTCLQMMLSDPLVAELFGASGSRARQRTLA